MEDTGSGWKERNIHTFFWFLHGHEILSRDIVQDAEDQKIPTSGGE